MKYSVTVADATECTADAIERAIQRFCIVLEQRLGGPQRVRSCAAAFATSSSNLRGVRGQFNAALGFLVALQAAEAAALQELSHAPKARFEVSLA